MEASILYVVIHSDLNVTNLSKFFHGCFMNKFISFRFLNLYEAMEASILYVVMHSDLNVTQIDVNFFMDVVFPAAVMQNKL